MRLHGVAQGKDGPPGGGLERRRRTVYEMARQPVTYADGVVVEAAADADLVPAHRVEAVRLDHDRLAVADAHANRAAGRARVAGGRNPLLALGDPLVRLLKQRCGGADVDARAAEVA